jgi:hypothetical protein
MAKKKNDGAKTTLQGPWSAVTAGQMAKVGFHMILPRKVHTGKTLHNPVERSYRSLIL